MKKPEINLDGAVRSQLLKGAIILKSNYDGRDWHILLEHPKGSEWRFGSYKTMKRVIEHDSFALMTSYNLTKKRSADAYYKDFYEDMHYVDMQKKKVTE